MFSARSISILIVILAIGLSSSLTALSEANEEKQSSKKTEKIPTTLDGIWYEVKENQQELEGVIKNKQLSKVHESAFHIRDLVSAMPGKSTNLPAANLSKVKMNVKFLDTLASRLDEAGDANDQVRTEATYKKFSDVLKSIEAQYPPETLKFKGTDGDKG